MEQAGEWALPEWTVLAVVREGPTHGFAIAALTASTGELGRVWQLPRPVVYRALSRLAEAGLVAPAAVESGPGPRRTVYEVTARGAAAADGWLAAPVRHVRQPRSHLLMKLALLDRRGLPAADRWRRSGPCWRRSSSRSPRNATSARVSTRCC